MRVEGGSEKRGVQRKYLKWILILNACTLNYLVFKETGMGKI